MSLSILPNISNPHASTLDCTNLLRLDPDRMITFKGEAEKNGQDKNTGVSEKSQEQTFWYKDSLELGYATETVVPSISNGSIKQLLVKMVRNGSCFRTGRWCR